jgi:hypothetical protein
MSWLQSANFDDLPAEERKSGGGGDNYRPFPFYLDYEETAKLVFLSGNKGLLTIKAHELWGVEQYPVYVPCLASDGKDCPICDYVAMLPEKEQRKVAAVNFFLFSVLDTRIVEKDGKTYGPTRKYLMTKRYALDKVIAPVYQMCQEEYQSDIVGAVVRVSRSKKPSAGASPAKIGDSMQLVKMVNPDKWPDEFLIKIGEDMKIPTPFNEEELMSIFVTDEDKIAEYADRLKGKSSTPSADWSKVV